MFARTIVAACTCALVISSLPSASATSPLRGNSNSARLRCPNVMENIEAEGQLIKTISGKPGDAFLNKCCKACKKDMTCVAFTTSYSGGWDGSELQQHCELKATVTKLEDTNGIADTSYQTYIVREIQ